MVGSRVRERWGILTRTGSGSGSGECVRERERERVSGRGKMGRGEKIVVLWVGPSRCEIPIFQSNSLFLSLIIFKFQPAWFLPKPYATPTISPSSSSFFFFFFFITIKFFDFKTATYFHYHHFGQIIKLNFVKFWDI